MRIRSLMLLVALLALGLLLSGCGDRPEPESTEPPVETTDATEQTPAEPVETAGQPVEQPESVLPRGEIVAYANGRPAYRDDFENAKVTLLNQYLQMYAQFGLSVEALLAGGEGRLFQLSLEAEAIRRVLAAALVEEEAERRGLQPSAEAIQADYESQYAEFLEAQGWTEEDFLAYLDEQGSSFEAFKQTGLDTVEWQLTLDAVRAAVAGPIDLTDEDLAAHFEVNKADYATEEQIQASHILFGTTDADLQAFLDENLADYGSEEDPPELEAVKDRILNDIRALAERIRGELTSGADFAEMAIEHSTGPSGPRGGELGWFGRGAMVAPFEEAAFALSIGEISDIVVTQYGLHIIQLTDRQAAYEPTLDDVGDQVRADLEEETLNARMQTWFDEVYDAAEFEILPPLVRAMWEQQKSVDEGIAAFEQVRDEGSADEPYLPYIIGTLYETKMYDLRSELSVLEAEAGEGVDRAVKIADLEVQIADYLVRALAEYRLAAEAIPDDPSIQSKIDDLEAQLAEGQDETPDAEETAE